jgi:hypothetical protein
MTGDDLVVEWSKRVRMGRVMEEVGLSCEGEGFEGARSVEMMIEDWSVGTSRRETLTRSLAGSHARGLHALRRRRRNAVRPSWPGGEAGGRMLGVDDTRVDGSDGATRICQGCNRRRGDGRERKES